MKPDNSLCHECAYDTEAVEFVGRTVKYHWYCAYSRPEHGRVQKHSECDYFEEDTEDE